MNNYFMSRKIVALIVCSLLTLHCQANETFSEKFQEQLCTHGSHQELYQFFMNENYIVFAQGKRRQPDGKIKDFADVLFLVSPDMQYFHAAILNGVKYDYFKACIFTSAREVDYQFASPVPGILARKNREHQIFLSEDMPTDGQCPANTTACTTWTDWSHEINNFYLLSAYTYSTKHPIDPYNEIIDLTVDSKTIHPTRGKLTQHARLKYALRVRNELKESKDDVKAAKTVYRNIYNEVDHQLPLMHLKLSDDRRWKISEIDRTSGLVWNILEGIDLELYPMQNEAYKSFTSQ